ncbi:hypothetical protein IV203_017728 [Nitzschia inconspicua]|uniref:Uncharacterized protein n=1 Tax=Nitzschia inconspicua TaxID=303405 RepID=A0A9K3P7T3_9STRA|nr:hypothetical protein IV203_017728 [Nitzschia inconspicua]
MAFTALTAMERSLVDDASTTKSDADTTLATEDTYPLKHESDMMLVQQKSTNTAASSHSENLRVYTDDEDDEEAVNDDQSHYHMEDDHSNNDDNLSWDASKRPTLNGGSSINTGSTYEETPFLSQKYSASAVRAHQGQKNGDLNHLQAQQEQSSLQQPQNQSGYDQDNESFLGKRPNLPMLPPPLMNLAIVGTPVK